jgi:hypothetical protein
MTCTGACLNCQAISMQQHLVLSNLAWRPLIRDLVLHVSWCNHHTVAVMCTAAHNVFAMQPPSCAFISPHLRHVVVLGVLNDLLCTPSPHLGSTHFSRAVINYSHSRNPPCAPARTHGRIQAPREPPN